MFSSQFTVYVALLAASMAGLTAALPTNVARDGSAFGSVSGSWAGNNVPVAPIGELPYPGSTVNTAPSYTNGSGQQKTVSVDYCAGRNYASPCEMPSVRVGKCTNVPSHWHAKVVSFRPTSHGVSCTLYSGYGCSGISQTISTAHGSKDLSQIGLGGQLSSFSCSLQD